ncbi:hypothetical protein NHP214376_12930 [Helicobacter ailurogastricus]|nr:hypothetical protein NHP214376_12930 [Helicobacter ailurogastricus]GLH60074.1 hypothetical protein NHP214377_13460 [Helicobacter ailurogastricus]
MKNLAQLPRSRAKAKGIYGVRYVRFENNFIKVADQKLDYPSATDKERFALPAIV